MIIDVFATIDDNPAVLKRPLLPFSRSSYRLPLFAAYEPQAAGWPPCDEPWYRTESMYVNALLIAGRRFPFTEEPLPPAGYFSMHVEESVTYVCIGFALESLWMYRRIEIVATTNSVNSLYGSKEPDGSPNPPMLLSAPNPREKADALQYARFSFEKVKLSFIRGRQSILLYGGLMALSMRHKGAPDEEPRDYPLGKYIVDGITHDVDKVAMEGIDYRYLLNFKYPTETFDRDRDRLPFLEDEYVGKTKPSMIGIGNGVPGIPLNGSQIYRYRSFPDTIDRYDFQFPPGWTEVYKIEVSVSGQPVNEKDTEGWIEIWPGLGNPNFGGIRRERGDIEGGDDDEEEDKIGGYQREHPFDLENPSNPAYPPFGPYDPNNPRDTRPQIDPDSGIVRVWWSQALKGGEFGNKLNSVRMFAKWPNSQPEKAFRFLLEKAGGDLLEGFEGEFEGLAPVGLYMGESRPIFEWIEKLQAANTIGGQLMLSDGSLHFRQENPNRARLFSIPRADVLNHETLPVSLAGDFMHSGWELSYKKAWGSDSEEGRMAYPNYRNPTAGILTGLDLTARFSYEQTEKPERPEKDEPPYTIEYFDVAAIRKRSRIISDMTAGVRHRITGLELPMARAYLELLVYDVVGYVPRALEDTGRAMIDWIVYEKKMDLKNETVALTLVERVTTRHWEHPPPPSKMGGAAETLRRITREEGT